MLPGMSSTNAPRLWTFDAVDAVLAHRYPHLVVNDPTSPDHGRLLPGSVSRIVGIDHRTTKLGRAKGLTSATADAVAVRLGYLPSDLWDEWGHDVIPDLFDDDPLDDLVPSGRVTYYDRGVAA